MAYTTGHASIFLIPHVTEKAAIHEEASQYVVRVSPKATKGEVRQEFMARFGIKPLKINMLQQRQKPRRRGAFVGYKKGYKKAVITVPKGKKIDIFPK
ncbi:MAG: 50S ribosomal protein L23 [Candidatus Terrybacteria bacterium RIFCSPLOWO2_01_FULL_44_24]|uniref:Large ribosomal subunit protein uL23 n=1 Tax=Candidatus Terrybacteria bacterium RIFCSPHIGHO2_01_FULL_43_35 TaxID=1802361 RepID=A0A1G2PF65_9BACT|nr:MAG: 50S ribosomal protein L23 [Candidatus Terrybacteria bacterium RIFCSPHIGHO2_01_FULL_43_35]OHA49448.1 MAG: 50S ribosomal protein L23 [Candidatus Terrybacteria bacterium RIFCSPHIGHO2_02_FULL_43_14]OHA51670.1 MAG: 50S ribosomal protein L23 [Candidatus Terrybacteria bacterium RIFCSPLOWO2_01_FULL_44_24]